MTNYRIIPLSMYKCGHPNCTALFALHFPICMENQLNRQSVCLFVKFCAEKKSKLQYSVRLILGPIVTYAEEKRSEKSETFLSFNNLQRNEKPY